MKERRYSSTCSKKLDSIRSRLSGTWYAARTRKGQRQAVGNFQRGLRISLCKDQNIGFTAGQEDSGNNLFNSSFGYFCNGSPQRIRRFNLLQSTASSTVTATNRMTLLTVFINFLFGLLFFLLPLPSNTSFFPPSPH